ncbi:MAG: right-handed parallel beta-helix repeat-containing protein [Roseibacillus sp.]
MTPSHLKHITARSLLVFLVSCLSLNAQIYVDASATGSNNGTSWTNAYNNLQDALAAVPSFGSSILVAEGVYYPDEGGSTTNNDSSARFSIPENAILFGGYPAGGGSASTRDPYHNRTTLSGDITQDDIPAKKGNPTEFVGTNSLTVVSITSGNLTSLDGFEIRNGDIGINFHGSAGAVCERTIEQCFIVNNSIGVRMTSLHKSSFTIPLFINCQFSGNSDEAVFVDGAKPSFLNCTFQGNAFAIYALNGNIGVALPNTQINKRSNLSFTNCIFWNNYPLDSSYLFAEEGSDGIFLEPPFVTPGGVQHFQAQASYTNCMRQTPTATVSPQFIEELQNDEIPSHRGLLRLGLDSDSIDAGVAAPDAGTLDLADNPRVRGASIDQGCFEHRGYIYVDQAAGPGGNGASWASSFQTLEAALIVSARGQHILLAKGDYYPDETDKRSDTFTIDDIFLYGGYPAGGGLPKERDPNFHKTTLSGDLLQNGNTISDDSHHVVTIPQKSFGVIDGVTIIRGNTEGATDKRGAAIYAPSEAQLFLRNSSLLQNTSTTNAGGIYLGSNSAASIENCLFNENNAAGKGGGIYASSSAVHLSNTTFDDNAAFRGGAIYGLSTSGEWNESLFDGNNASDSGGAAYLITSLPGHRVTSTTFRDNAAASQDGGALLESGQPSSFEGCLFEGNSAGDDGGAVSTSSAGSVFENCRFKGNAANDNGGGLWILAASPDIIHCGFHGNSAGGDGGGFAMSFNSQPEVSGTWIWQNSASGVTNTLSASAFIPPRTAATFIDFIDETSYLHNFPEAPLLFDGMNGPTIQVASELDPLASPQTGGDLHLVYPSPSVANSDPLLLGPDLAQKFIIGAGDVSGLRAALAIAEPFDVVYLPAGNYDLLNESLVVRPGTQLGSSSAKIPSTQIGDDPTDVTPTQPLVRRQGTTRLRPYLFTTGDFASRAQTLLSLQGSATLFNLDIGTGRASEPASLAGLGSAIRTVSLGEVKIHDSELLGGVHTGGSDLSLYRARVSSNSFSSASISGSNADISLEDTCFHRSRGIQITNGSLTAVNTEFGGLRDGAIIADFSTVSLVNCGFTRSRSSNEDHDIQILNNSILTATNSFAWGYDPNNNFDLDWIEIDSSSGATFSHCLIQGMNPAGTGNLNGNLTANDPLLVRFDTATDLLGSPPLERALPSHLSNCIDAGLSTANTTTKDLNNSLRIRGSSIDIGPHEHHRIYVDETAILAETGDNWANALRDLPADLTAIRGATSIYVAKGNYSQAILAPAGLQLFGGFPKAGSTFALRQPKVHETLLMGGIENYNRFLDSGSVESFTGRPTNDVPGVLDGFIIEDSVDSNSVIILGNIHLVENCIFRNNASTSTTFGGYQPGGSSLRIPAGTFSNVRNCRFEGNTAAAWGGAVLVFGQEQTSGIGGSGFHYFENCLFLSNSAGFGGAVMFHSDSGSYSAIPARFPTMFFQFEDCAFKGNSATSEGGAVYIGAGAYGEFRDCVMQGNRSDLFGGAIGRNIGLTDAGQFRSTVDFTNCTIQGNFAAVLGGGVDGVADYINTVLWGNRAAEGNNNFTEPIPSFGLLNSFENCLVDGINLEEEPTATASWTGNLDGTDSANNPRFRVEISAAEAPTLRGDLRLTTSSPLLHAGTLPFASFIASNPVDAAGNSRLQGPAIALGAYETPVAPFYTPTETAVWESDLDGDGTSHGAELLLGTDPNIADPCHPNAFTLVSAGKSPGTLATRFANFTLGVSPTAPANSHWVVTRSLTLEPGSFQDLLLYDGTDLIEANPFGPVNSSSNLSSGLINLNSNTIDVPKVFYRFEARRAPEVSYPQ